MSGPRIFVSYARSDGRVFAKALSARLQVAGFSLWRDLADMEGGRDWWQQIEEAIRAVEYLILVISEAALKSDYVRREWRFARQEGTCVIPVLAGAGLTGSETFRAFPGWMRRVHFVDTSNTEQWTRLVRTLEGPCEVRRVPFMAGDPPEGFVDRPREMEAVIGHLVLDDRNDPVAITGVLQGAGGFGKTALAKALCHHPRVEEAFDDGILWVTLGEQPGDLKGRIFDLIFAVTGQRPPVDELQTAIAELAKALGERRMLIVIDDVWDAAHLRPFLDGGPNCARMVTTRNQATVPAMAATVRVDAMQPDEATALLLQSAGLAAERLEELAALAERLGDWPLMLKLLGAQLRERVCRLNEPVDRALEWVGRALTKRGLTAFDIENPTERDQGVAATLEASLSLLSEDERQRFAELAVFPEDAVVPLATVQTLWAATGGLDDLDSDDLARKLFGLSLLLDLDLARRSLRLHDVIRTYLLPPDGGGRVALHRSLINAYQAECPEGWERGPDDGYFFQTLPHHLAELGDREALDALLLDPGWLKAKLAASGAQGLVADYQHGHGRMQELIGRTLQLTSGILVHDRRQLLPQLLGRLMAVDDPLASVFLASARRLADRPALLTDQPSLTPPGAVTARLKGHGGPVRALAVLADGRLASGSSDKTVRLWDPATGAETALREEHTDWVRALAVLADGRLASGSYDGIVRLWDPVTSAETARPEGHTDWVMALAVLADGRLASGSHDKTVRLWDPETGRETARLEGHCGAVMALAVLADGRLASGSADNTVRLWDPATGAETARLEGHTDWVMALTVLTDGRLASGSYDKTVRLWDPATGAETVRLEGHTDWVRALAVLADGRLASGSADNTVRLWDPATGVELCRLELDGTVHSLAFLPDPDGDGWRLIAGDALGRLHWLRVVD